MRITRDTLLRIARETAQKRALSDPSLVAVYLTGSVTGPDPFLGGTTDVDLVIVHERPQHLRREIVPLTPDVHLDIIHAARSEYDNPKELRVHPQLGPELYNPVWLYESRHFLEFVQAAVRTRFHDPDNVLERARRNAHSARQQWMEMQNNPPEGPVGMQRYLLAVGSAADAVAALTGAPLAERRFLLDLPRRAEAAGHPELSAGIFNLVGTASLDAALFTSALPDWEKAFMAACGSPMVHASIAAPRLSYYQKAFTSMLEAGQPGMSAWALLHSWMLAAQVLPPAEVLKWYSFCERLGLSGESFSARIAALDQYLDTLEELFDGMAHG